jgi:phosphate transport system permease protein
MTDLAMPVQRARAIDIASLEAKARLRARYRAERRFRAYGMLAVLFAGLFIVVLVADIVLKGLPAFTSHRLMIEVTPTAGTLGVQPGADAAALRGADHLAVIRDRLGEIFPEVTGRAERRKLYGELLSSGAPDALRDALVADPSAVGRRLRVPVLLSDDADLYLKGAMTRMSERTGQTTLSVDGTSGKVTLTAGGTDFAAELETLRREISRRVRDAEAEAARMRRLLAGLTPAERAGLDARIGEFDKEIAELSARLTPGASTALNASMPSVLVAVNGGLVKVDEIGRSSVSGTALTPLSSAQAAPAGSWRILTLATPESNRRLDDRQVAWLEKLRDTGLVENVFNWRFFTRGDSREPELAGLLGGLIGSALTMLVTLLICLPLGVGAAIYLEEFAPKNRFTDLIEVNINNLAAVPSIVFGLLGLAVFLNFFGMPRSAPLVGGLVLALLVLPTIIIASRAALKAVPPSIREAALGVGASHQQAVFHHVLPLAMPGILTGTIIGMAHALGESAPLLMIGMVAFIVDVPTGVTDAATVLPVQIFTWSDLPEPLFQAKTAAAIMVLLLFLFVMNGLAVVLRKTFERRW